MCSCSRLVSHIQIFRSQRKSNVDFACCWLFLSLFRIIAPLLIPATIQAYVWYWTIVVMIWIKAFFLIVLLRWRSPSLQWIDACLYESVFLDNAGKIATSFNHTHAHSPCGGHKILPNPLRWRLAHFWVCTLRRCYPYSGYCCHTMHHPVFTLYIRCRTWPNVHLMRFTKPGLNEVDN